MRKTYRILEWCNKACLNTFSFSLECLSLVTEGGQLTKTYGVAPLLLLSPNPSSAMKHPRSSRTGLVAVAQLQVDLLIRQPPSVQVDDSHFNFVMLYGVIPSIPLGLGDQGVKGVGWIEYGPWLTWTLLAKVKPSGRRAHTAFQHVLAANVGSMKPLANCLTLVDPRN